MQTTPRCLAFIVKDTKTYMNIEEARFRYSSDSDTNILFIIVPRYIQNNLPHRLKETVNEELWDKIVWVYTRSNSISSKQKSEKAASRFYGFCRETLEFVYNFLDRRELDALAAEYGPCEWVFSAHKNTQEHLAAKLNPKKLFLVDSGHRIFNRINRDGFIDYSRWFVNKSRYTRYMHRFTGLTVFDRSKTVLFTVYADEIETNHSVEKNEFSYQNHLLNSKEVGDDVVWISTPIYVMAEGVSIDDYISYIKACLIHLDVNSDRVIYIPHPGKQTPDEIAKIVGSLNCRVDDRGIPVEFKIANYSELPRLCISPFSSALVNIEVASGGRIKAASAWHYEFNHFQLWLNWKRDVEKNPGLGIEFIELIDCNPLFYIESGRQTGSPPYFNFSDWKADRN